MTFSEMLEEFISLKLEGRPEDSRRQREAYDDRIQELRDGIDRAMAGKSDDKGEAK